jgi:hypothetical protein
MDSNKFNSGFSTIADQFRNKGVASNKQRMAGDYLSEFTKDSGVQSVLGNKDYRNGTKNTESKPSAVMSTLGSKPTPTPTSPPTPAPEAKVSAQPVGPGQINYDAMVDARMAKATKGEINGGVNREYWMKQYKKNNAEYEQNKTLVNSYQGPKNWDEFSQLDQSRTGNAAERNRQTIASHGAYTKYKTAEQNMKHWEEATKAYRS